MFGYKIGPDLLEKIRQVIRLVLKKDYAFLNRLKSQPRANRVPPNVQFVRVTGEPVGGLPEEEPEEGSDPSSMSGFGTLGTTGGNGEPPDETTVVLWCDEDDEEGKTSTRLYYPAEVVVWDYCGENWKALGGKAWLFQANGGTLNVDHVYLARQVGGSGMIEEGESPEDPRPPAEEEPREPPTGEPPAGQPSEPKTPPKRPMFATDSGPSSGDRGCVTLKQQTCDSEGNLKTTCYKVCAPGLEVETLEEGECEETGPPPPPPPPSPTPTPTPTPTPSPTPIPGPVPEPPQFPFPGLRLPISQPRDSGIEPFSQYQGFEP